MNNAEQKFTTQKLSSYNVSGEVLPLNIKHRRKTLGGQIYTAGSRQKKNGCDSKVRNDK